MIAAGKDLINFVMILLILLFGFSIIGHLLFGHVLVRFSFSINADQLYNWF